jgi:hypothetical protein
MDIGYVLKRAWEIIWKFKVLWVFGILAGFSQAGTSSGSNSGWRYSTQGIDFSSQIDLFFARTSPGLVALMITLAIIIALALTVIVILVGTVGRVGLIRGTVKAEQGVARLTFRELWREGLTYFWRVFGLNLLIGVAIFITVIVLIVLAVVLTVGTLGLILLCLVPLLCLILPIWWAVVVIVEQANVALVVENLGIIEAIKRGWQVVWSNIGNMILMSLILLVGVSLIGGAIIGLPMLVVAAPAISGAAIGTSDAIRNGLIASGGLFIIYLPFLLLASGILRSYTSSAWTLTFLRLTNKPIKNQVEVPSEPENNSAPLMPSA